MNIARPIRCVIAIVLCGIGGNGAFGAPALSDEAFARWGDAQILFVGTLKKVQAGPVARSYPPIYIHKLTFAVDEVLRGELPGGRKVVASHRKRTLKKPRFPEGKRCIVAAARGRGGLVAKTIVAATDDTVATVRRIASIPLGWTVKNGRLLSPWTSQGKRGWTAVFDAEGLPKCSETGRPALSAGKGVALAVTPRPPGKKIKWTNPDGDGEYKIVVTNTTDKPLAVPALLSDGRNILWKESLAILCQGKVYPIPGAKPVTGKIAPTTLKPGESVECIVNALALEGPKWPRGGYRIEFQFCLGEKSQVKSFYYMSKHHDKLRKAARKGG